jgi:hypothetical protein
MQGLIRKGSSYGTTSSGLGLRLRESRIRRRMREAHDRFDAFVVSVPKCGRTWHRLMVGYYLTRVVGCDPRKALDLPMLCERAGVKQLAYTHNGSAYAHRLPASSKLMASPQEWTERDVLVLVRKPVDILLSGYHQVRYRHRRFEGTLSDFVRGVNTGIVKLLVAFNRWSDSRHLAASFDVASYEQMQRDPGEALRRALHFVGLREINQSIIQDAIDFTTPEYMRRYEDEGYFDTFKMRQTTTDPRGRKVRTGNIDSAQKFSAEDADFIADTIRQLGNPFARYCELDGAPASG